MCFHKQTQKKRYMRNVFLKQEKASMHNEICFCDSPFLNPET